MKADLFPGDEKYKKRMEVENAYMDDTALDVYKRQIDGSHFKHAVEKSDTGLFVHLRALRQRGGHAEVVQLEHFCAAPVSYTHLDVYKRQP